EDLVEHGEHALVGERAAVDDVLLALGHEATRHTIRERAERVVADHEVRTVLDGDIDVRRAPHAAVDVGDPLDPCRLVEAREGGGGGVGGGTASEMVTEASSS